jgi:ABC-type branched-subunit amino acid transport system substrate-binding protein
MGGIQNIIKFSDCRDFYVFLLLSFLSIVTLTAGSSLSEEYQDTFTIGATIPLSGELAQIGEDIKHGLELAVKDFSTEKLRFQLVLEDDQYKGVHAASAGIKLLNIDKVDAIISLWDMSEVISPVAEKSMTPHISIRWNPHLTEKYDYTMTIESTYISYVHSLISLLKELNISSVAIMTEEAEGYLLAYKLLKKELPGHGINIIRHAFFTPDETNHRGIILPLMKYPPDMIILFSNPPHMEIFAKRIKEMFGDGQKFTGLFQLENNLSVINNMPYVSQYKVEEWFLKKFRKAYGEDHIIVRSPQAYDIVSLIAYVQESSAEGMLKNRELLNAIKNLQYFKGASGTLHPNGSRVIESECAWEVVRDGKRYAYE